MKVAALAGVLLRDHYRRGAALALSACALSVLATTVMAVRAGGLRAEPFLLAGGRAICHVSTLAGSQLDWGLGGVYLLCVLAVGACRFRRREFYWS